MLKSLAMAALVGPLGLQSLPDQLKSTVAPSPEPAVYKLAPRGDGDGDHDSGLVDDLSWSGDGAGMFDIHHRYWHHGGQGGEGGEGGEGNYNVYNYPVHENYYPANSNQSSLFNSCNRDNLIGALVGAAAGGLAGSQIGKGNGQLVAVGAGVLIGALLGNEVGSRLGAGDLACAEQAGQQAHTVPVGQQIAWNNPQTGNSGYVVPVRDGVNQQTGQYCREYQTVVSVGGRQEGGYGTACYRPDGSWEIIN